MNIIKKIIIPFGEECYTAQSIDSKFTENSLRNVALPFDYVGHTYVENIYDNIVEIINTNNFICSKDDFVFQLFDDKYFLCHKKYGFKYWHDIYTYDNKNEMTTEINNFIEKYNRRYERLKEYLKYDNIFILSVNHFDNIFYKYSIINKQNTIHKLFNLLKAHNNNIKFIAVNFGEDMYNIPNLKFVNIPINYDLNFIESKQDFTKKLYDFIKTEF